jgi:hypothetical protein
VLTANRPATEESFGSEHAKGIYRKRIEVNGQGEEPYSILIANALHGLVAIRANERCARPAFVELLLGIAGTVLVCHISLRVAHGAEGKGHLPRHGIASGGLYPGFSESKRM